MELICHGSVFALTSYAEQAHLCLNAKAGVACTDKHKQKIMWNEVWHQLKFKHRISRCLQFIMCVAIVFTVSGCTPQRRVIKNETLDVWDGRRMGYKNLFPSNCRHSLTMTIRKLNKKSERRKPLDHALRKELMTGIRSQVEELSKLLRRDLVKLWEYNSGNLE